MAIDLRINEDFDIELDDRQDLAIVEGREAFEQHLSIVVTHYFHELIGTTKTSNLEQKIELQARRVINSVAGIEDVANVLVQRSEEEPNTIEVTVLYSTGEEFSFEVT